MSTRLPAGNERGGDSAPQTTVLAVGLTGGIGSGKSTVAASLVARGAVLIDADAIAREVVEPGGPAYQPLVDRFGPGILLADGHLDREAVAKLVFPDPEALADLNAITHPAVGTLMLERRSALAATEAVVILDIPLMKPEHRELLSLDLVVVVDCPVDIAVERLVGERGMDRQDAEARVAAQMSREERCRGADLVVDNSSDRENLERQVRELWDVLESRQEAGREAGRSQAP